MSKASEHETELKPAHGAVLTRAEVSLLTSALRTGEDTGSAIRLLEFSSGSGASTEEREAIAAYQRRALEIAKEGEVEVDEDAVVSPGSDPGAYVQAWLWVPAKDAGLGNDLPGA